MDLNRNTTIQDLLQMKLISQRTFNRLQYARLTTVKDIMEVSGTPQSLMEINGFGRKAYSEIEPILLQFTPKCPKKKEYNEPVNYEVLTTILQPIYNACFTTTDPITRHLKAICPTVFKLHNLLMHDLDRIFEIEESFSMNENIEYRSHFLVYLKETIIEFKRCSLANSYICSRYEEIYDEINKRLYSFSYTEKYKYFMTPSAKCALKSIYKDMRLKQSVRVNLFLNQYLPEIQDLLPFFNSQIEEYQNICSGRYIIETVKDVFIFTQLIRIEFDKLMLMSDKKAWNTENHLKYSFLNKEQNIFITDFKLKHNYYPLFFILYYYLLNSTAQSDNIFCKLYGVYDGEEHSIKEIADSFNLTRERIRQVITNKIQVHKTNIINIKEWEQYKSILSMPYITANSDEYIQIKSKENLPFDFRIFARLFSLLGEYNFKIEIPKSEGNIYKNVPKQYEVDEMYYKKNIIINRKKMPNIQLKECILHLQQISLERYSKDTCINIKSILDKMKLNLNEVNYAKDLLSYIARNIFKLKINNQYEILMCQNYIDIANELYTILKKKGSPMSIEDIFTEFKIIYPDHKYDKSSQIRHHLQRHPHIKSIGKTSHYGLDSWTTLFYGSIRDLIIKILTDSKAPVHINNILSEVQRHFPNTNIRSIKTTMMNDEKNRFIQFFGNFYGLMTKDYSKFFRFYKN